MAINIPRSTIFIMVTGILLLFVAYLQFSPKKRPLAPRIMVVSNCKSIKPGMRRIGEQYGFQFDVPVESFKIVEGAGDAPAEGHGYFLPLKNGASFLNISWGGMSLSQTAKAPIPAALISSDHAQERKIFDDKGNPMGKDSWGYLDSGTLWRRVRLRGSVAAEYGSVTEKNVASYGSVHEKDAELFDSIIGSTCYLSPPGS